MRKRNLFAIVFLLLLSFAVSATPAIKADSMAFFSYNKSENRFDSIYFMIQYDGSMDVSARFEVVSPAPYIYPNDTIYKRQLSPSSHAIKMKSGNITPEWFNFIPVDSIKISVFIADNVLGRPSDTLIDTLSYCVPILPDISIERSLPMATTSPKQGLYYDVAGRLIGKHRPKMNGVYLYFNGIRARKVFVK